MFKVVSDVKRQKVPDLVASRTQSLLFSDYVQLLARLDRNKITLVLVSYRIQAQREREQTTYNLSYADRKSGGDKCIFEKKIGHFVRE